MEWEWVLSLVRDFGSSYGSVVLVRKGESGVRDGMGSPKAIVWNGKGFGTLEVGAFQLLFLNAAQNHMKVGGRRRGSMCVVDGGHMACNDDSSTALSFFRGCEGGVVLVHDMVWGEICEILGEPWKLVEELVHKL
ncbi:hypothetical protein VNO80_26979 [Phaseolus coccineus]|uniref:Uncharacterized protein n=1 Tax=Phaseolus coccineus TaxID=3886 RepID=A0AAN9LJG7_PHACN